MKPNPRHSGGWRRWSLRSLPSSGSVLLGSWGPMPLARFLELSAWRFSGLCETAIWSASYLAWNVCWSELRGVDWPQGKSPLESPGHLTRWPVTAPLAKPLSAWATNDWLVLPPRAHVLLYRDKWWPILARDQLSFGVRPAIVVGRLPSRRVVRGRGLMDRVSHERWRRACGTPVSHDYWARVFCGVVRGWIARDLKGMVPSLSMKAPNEIGKFLRNQSTHQNNIVGIIKSQKSQREHRELRENPKRKNHEERGESIITMVITSRLL